MVVTDLWEVVPGGRCESGTFSGGKNRQSALCSSPLHKGKATLAQSLAERQKNQQPLIKARHAVLQGTLLRAVQESSPDSRGSRKLVGNDSCTFSQSLGAAEVVGMSGGQVLPEGGRPTFGRELSNYPRDSDVL